MCASSQSSSTEPPVRQRLSQSDDMAYSSEILEKAVRQVWSLKPARIVKDLDLLKPIYSKTATYGHFGRDELNLPWEQTDMVEKIKMALLRWIS